MSDDAAITIADLDKSGATTTVAPTTAPAEAPASQPAESAPAASETAQTEPKGEGEPENQAKPEGEEPEWFKKRLKEFSRQRRSAERTAERLAAENEDLRRQVQSRQSQQPKAADLKPEQFSDFAAFTKAQTVAAVREELETANQATAERDSHAALQRSIKSFADKASAQAEEADVDFDAVMETLSAQPLLSPTVVSYLEGSEVPAKLAEHLALNPTDLHRVSMMGPALARKELAKMEAGLKPAAAKPPVTKAPPVPPRVGGRGVTQKSVEDMDMDEFALHFQNQQEARAKRV